jgi:hypothetical protein
VLPKHTKLTLNSQSNTTKLWDLPTARIHLREDGIVVYEMKEGTVQTIKDYQEIVLTLIRIIGTKKRPMLTIVSKGAQVKPDAMAYSRKVEYLIPINAIGLVVPGRMEYVLAKAYQVVQKTHLEHKVFFKQDEAIEWLRQYVPEETQIPVEF